MVRVMTTATAGEGDTDVYRSPPPAVAAFVERPQSPSINISPHRDQLLYTMRPPPYPFVSELARPELKLAGLRIDETQNSRSRMSGSTAMAIGPMPAVESDIGVFEYFTGIPEGATLNFVSWSFDGARDRVHRKFRRTERPGPRTRSSRAVDRRRCHA